MKVVDQFRVPWYSARMQTPRVAGGPVCFSSTLIRPCLRWRPRSRWLPCAHPVLHHGGATKVDVPAAYWPVSRNSWGVTARVGTDTLFPSVPTAIKQLDSPTLSSSALSGIADYSERQQPSDPGCGYARAGIEPVCCWCVVTGKRTYAHTHTVVSHNSRLSFCLRHMLRRPLRPRHRDAPPWLRSWIDSAIFEPHLVPLAMAYTGRLLVGPGELGAGTEVACIVSTTKANNDRHDLPSPRRMCI